MDTRGQISIELILLLGFILVIVLIVASIAGPQIEKNSVSSSVREGATDAIYELTSTNVNLPPTRVNKLIVKDNGNVTINVTFSSSLPTNYKPFILNRTIQSVLNQSGFTQVNNTTVKGNNKFYTIFIN